ncbi:uncharacterized protein LOC110927755 [Helianthus annuus]|uniref:uncharacterized protein LOC110927755 n=1 Tax=Helianthus annuus TaxID=4232 RepID=UPI000B8FB1CF|nr:uncharacterized protein LOC110927755 [Helianthus annuus]
MDTKLHPTVTVTNIKSFIPITLESDSAQSTTWSEFFRIHCRAFLVSDHLERPATTTSDTTKTTDTEKTSTPKTALDSWERLDEIVLQWIYGTISSDLVQTHYEERLHCLCCVGCPRGPELKVIADQLNNIEAPVDDQSLVLQTLAGFTDSYEVVAIVLGNTKPLPSFNEVRS